MEFVIEAHMPDSSLSDFIFLGGALSSTVWNGRLPSANTVGMEPMMVIGMLYYFDLPWVDVAFELLDFPVLAPQARHSSW